MGALQEYRIARKDYDAGLDRPPVDVMFVRGKELEGFANNLKDLYAGRKAKKMFALYGVPGIGKSMLLSAMASEIEKGGGSAFVVDFENDPDRSEWVMKPQKLMRAQLDSLKLPATDRAEFDEAYQILESDNPPAEGICMAWERLDFSEKYSDQPGWVNNLARLTNAWERLLLARKEAGKVDAIIFDNTDQALNRQLNFLEYWMMARAALGSNTVIGFASRRPHRWMVPELRWSRSEVEIGPVADDQSAYWIAIEALRAAPLLVSERIPLAQAIAGYAHGNPKLIQIMAESVNRQKRESENVYLGVVCRDGYHEYVEEYAMKGVREPLKRIVGMVGMTSMLSDHHLMHILKTLDPEQFGQYELPFFMSMHSELEWSGLLEWGPADGYAVNHDLRAFIQEYWKMMEPDMYMRVHKASLAWTRSILDIKGVGGGVFVAQEVYHLAAAGEYRARNIKKILRSRLNKMRKAGFDAYGIALWLKDVLPKSPDLERACPGMGASLAKYLGDNWA